jgi:hypothetical protein
VALSGQWHERSLPGSLFLPLPYLTTPRFSTLSCVLHAHRLKWPVHASPASAPIFQAYPAHGVTPGRSYPSITSRKQRTTATSPTPPFFNQGHEKPIHFFQTAVTRQKSNPHAHTCRLSMMGYYHYLLEKKQNKKENACTGIAFAPCR